MHAATSDPSELLDLLKVGLDAFELAKAALEAAKDGAFDTALAAGKPCCLPAFSA